MRRNGRFTAAMISLILAAGFLTGCGGTSRDIQETVVSSEAAADGENAVSSETVETGENAVSSEAAADGESAAGSEAAADGETAVSSETAEAGETAVGSGAAAAGEDAETAESASDDIAAKSKEDGETVSGADEAVSADEETAESESAEEEIPAEALEADVVVVGAGGAGMVAAVTAAQSGKAVLVIEKTDAVGGNTALAQDAVTEEVSAALHADDDGSSGVTVRYNTAAKHFIVEEGYVTGVECESQDGSKVLVKAYNGVVLATGGFACNVAMRTAYNSIGKKWPSVGDNIGSTNTPASTGDGILMAEEIGAQLSQMSDIQLLPIGDPESGSLSGSIVPDSGSYVFINEKGERFVDENADNDTRVLALFGQPDDAMFVLTDGSAYPTGEETNDFGETINGLAEAGRVYKADTLEELAGQIGLSAERLTAAAEELKTPPYYAAKRVPTVHHTMGGVKVDGYAQVLDTENNIIPGLYAAGEVTAESAGSWQGYGNTLVRTMVQARIAGKRAAAFLRQQQTRQ